MHPTKHYLGQGNIFAHKDPHLVYTVLGSCISVCLWDKEKRIGGINHFMLPELKDLSFPDPKYGNVAMPMLLKKMIGMGSDKKDLIAKIFGGACMGNKSFSAFYIGQNNISIAQNFLRNNTIKIARQSTGGFRERTIWFNTETGDVYLKKRINEII